jgi:hypothetical protein
LAIYNRNEHGIVITFADEFDDLPPELSAQIEAHERQVWQTVQPHHTIH